jgi:hypothetical protein
MNKIILSCLALFLISCDGTYTSYSYDPTPTTTVRYIPTQTHFARTRLYTTSQYYEPYYASRHYPSYISYPRRSYCPPTVHRHVSQPVRVRTSKYKSKTTP